MSIRDKKAFYTCPIGAQYMKDMFGMKFRSQLNIESYFDDEFLPASLVRNEEKGYIHPDSLHLLEPQKGDLIHIVRGFCCYYKRVADIATGGGKRVTGIWSDGEHWDIATKEPLHDWEIIQRDGKPFFWPEFEPSAVEGV